MDFNKDNNERSTDTLLKEKITYWLNILGIYHSLNDKYHLKIIICLDIKVD